MYSINRVDLLGNLGQDPETRYLPTGKPVTTMSLATSKTWKDRETSEKREATEWHRLTAFGKLAEICSEYLRKGDKAYFTGELRTRKWDKEGQTHYTTEVIVSEVIMLSGGNNTGEDPTVVHKADPNDFNDDIPF